MSEALNNEIVMDVFDEMGIIGPNTKVEGDIATKGHITILGSVTGNIEAKGNIIIRGIVTGTIKCHNVLFEGENTDEVDVLASGQVSIGKGVTINGKIECDTIKIQGTVNGDIKAKDKIGLAETALVVGNVTAGAMAMALGSKIKGNFVIE